MTNHRVAIVTAIASSISDTTTENIDLLITCGSELDDVCRSIEIKIKGIVKLPRAKTGEEIT